MMDNWVETKIEELMTTTTFGAATWRVALDAISLEKNRDDLLALMISISHNGVDPMVIVDVMKGLSDA